MKSVVSVVAFVAAATCASAEMGSHVFSSIDGGSLSLKDWAGQPILVVNTASQCAFTGQYDALQKLYERYEDDGLVVLAVPSDDFSQELDTAEEVKEFCELNFALDLPMADITSIRGDAAHSFYQDVKAQTGFEPRWNFNKVLIGKDGAVLATWGSNVKPLSRQVTKKIEAALNAAS